MESQKIINLLEIVIRMIQNFKQRNGILLMTKTMEIKEIKGDQNGKGDQNDSTIKFSTEIVKPFLVDYSDAYILVTGDITVVGGDGNTKDETIVTM